MLPAALLSALILLAISSSAQAQDPVDSGSGSTAPTTTTPTTTTTAAYGTLDLTLHSDGLWPNDSPAGLWSDGKKLWVSDQNFIRGVFLYDLETGNHEGRYAPWWRGQRYFGGGIWSDGKTMWVADGNGTRVETYGHPGLSGSRKKYAAFADRVFGLWSDGTRMWMSVPGEYGVGRGALSGLVSAPLDNGSNRRQEIKLWETENRHATGIWSDGLTIWVADDSDDKIYAYDLDSKLPLPALDIDVLKEAGNNSPQGLWSNDGETLWVVDSQDAVIYTYPLPPNLRLGSLSFSGLEPPHQFQPGRVDYGQVVVPSGVSSTTVAAAAMSDDVSLTIMPADSDASLDGHQVALATGDNLISVTVTAGGRSMTYSLLVKRSVHPIISDDASFATFSVDEISRLVWGTDDKLHPDDADGYYYYGAVSHDVSQVTLRYQRADPTASLSVSPEDAEPTIDGHQVNLSAGAETTVELTVVSSDETETHTLRLKLARDGSGRHARLFTREFRFLNPENLWPWGLWSDGETMWIAGDRRPRAFAYDMESKERASGSDVSGWTHPYDTPGYYGHMATDIWSDGSVLWLVDRGIPRLASFDMMTDAALQVTPNLESYDMPWAVGVWSDGTTIWVLQTDTRRQRDHYDGPPSFEYGPTGLYAFDPDTLARLPDADLMLKDVPSDKSFGSMWADGETVWIADARYNKLLAWDLESGARQADFDVPLASANGSALGVWSDGEVMWVSDWADARVYAYQFGDDTFLASLDVAGVDLGQFSKGRVRYEAVVPSGVSQVTVTATRASDSASVSIVPNDADASADGHQVDLVAGENVITVTVTAGSEVRVYTVVIERSAHAVLSSDASLSSLALSGADLGGFRSDLFRYDALLGSADSSTTVSFQASDNTASVTVSPADADSTTAGHQVSVPASGVVTVRVTVVSSDRTARSVYTVRVARDAAAGGRRVLFDLDALDGAANNSPQGLWSDGKVMWVSDWDREMVFAYDLRTKQRVEAKELAPLHVEDAIDESGKVGNSEPWGIWSDGSTIWVGDGTRRHIYAYELAGGTRIAAKELDLSDLSDLQIQGIWSNGTTLWVVDYAGDTVYAYDLASGDRNASLDVALSAANTRPRGIWSDGAHLWVADSDDGKVYAYGLDSGRSFPLLEIDLDSANASPRGIWSDGSTLWVADTVSDKVYAYRMPATASQNTVVVLPALGSLVLSGVELAGSFSADVLSYEAESGAGVTSTTVTAEAASGDATVTISPADSDALVAGHQVELGVGENTIEVTVGSGSSSQTYTVVVTRLAASGLVDNRVPVGLPLVGGTVRVGETLTADVSGISDADGLDAAVFGFQWLADDVVIVGATGSSYTLVASDLGKAIKVRIGFTDDEGNEESLTSVATGAVVADVPSYLPLLATLAFSDVELSPGFDPKVFAFAAKVPYETSVTTLSASGQSSTAAGYIDVRDADRGTPGMQWGLAVGENQMRITVSENGYHSTYTIVITRLDRPALAGSFHDVPDDHDGTQFTFEFRLSEQIAGLSYVTVRDHVIEAAGGRVVKARRLVRGSNQRWEITVAPEGSGGVALSVPAAVSCGDAGAVCTADGRPLSVVAELTVPGPSSRPPVNSAATGRPTISGTAQAGEKLSADTSAIADADGLDDAVFSYQWLADDDPITGADGSTYTLVASDQGKAIKVRVSFTDDAGNRESLTSAATSPVAAALTGSFHEIPDDHDGTQFTFEFRLSEQIAGLSYITVRDRLIQADGGRIVKARRLVQGSNQRWEITVVPDSNGDITLSVPAPASCDDTGAVCTADGRKLSAPRSVTVPGPD